ncbi:nucleotide exchange factor GrpE [Cellulophaga baltica]|uniref:nucleotide exchange factor GrpE n=1 Tax=Cellulophaga TaxID=104264 RepID=UPI001C067AD1|nr:MULTISPECIES: nucleotide exchange factor GrpE [Cellulophaga]MBU2996882.1 nucleotide exchange factor GrpE [Cellulophaga baltica]MDO6768279.1 nucleotide exchange factor GrpE [Cellulophaga sp. 1_MG-2023]
MSDKNKSEDIVDENLEQEVPETQEEQVEVEELSVEEQLKEDLAKEKDKFLRLFAEFENYKKRTSKERMDLFRTAGQEVIVALLPVSDDFDRALPELAKSEDKEMFKGVELIQNKFKQVLKAKGLEEVEAKAGDVFDAEIHDAITQIPAPDKKMKGKIIDVIEKGFKLGDKIIRHPKVVVGN